MRRTKIAIMVLTGSMLLVACSVKDLIYGTDHPEMGKITVITDWNGIGQEMSKPADYTVAFGGETHTTGRDTLLFFNPFMPGSYTIHAWNVADKITVSGMTATVAPVGGDTIASLPGWFFTGREEVRVEADADHEFTVKMVPQVRQLTLVIEPSGGMADNVATITSRLSGVAGSCDMTSGAHGSASAIALTFTKQTTGIHAGKWTASLRLLGVAGGEQRLAGVITFTGGAPDVPLESDLTGSLITFNEDKKNPLTLGGTLIETPTGAGFTATITDWMPGTGGSVVAN